MLSKTKCRLGANRETSPRNDDPLNFDSLITASKWTSCNAEWQNKISSLCLNTVAGYSEEAPSILWVYHSYAYQYLSKFSANRGSYVKSFPWLMHWTKRFGAYLQTGCKWLRWEFTRIHLSTKWDRLCFLKASWRDLKQNRIFLQRN